jgi:hypothetical protein
LSALRVRTFDVFSRRIGLWLTIQITKGCEHVAHPGEMPIGLRLRHLSARNPIGIDAATHSDLALDLGNLGANGRPHCLPHVDSIANGEESDVSPIVMTSRPSLLPGTLQRELLHGPQAATMLVWVVLPPA